MQPSTHGTAGPAIGGGSHAAGSGREGLLRRLASLRLTLCLIVLLGVGTALALRLEEARTWPMVIPLALLATNLLAAIATNGVFRRQTPLLVFHLSLVALLLLVAAGRLTYLRGNVGVTDGTSFEGVLSEQEAGPWHRGALATVRFISEGFTIDYAPGLQRKETRNRVKWPAVDGTWQHAVIGDQEPLVLRGYRFYTTFNKGFAPVFRWRGRDGEEIVGSVQLPPYPAHEHGQAVEWMPPGSGTPVWVMLDITGTVIDSAERSSFRLPDDYVLIVRSGDARHELRPGDQIALVDGTLRFEGLRAWMGYRVFYDWTLPWLLAAGVVAVASLTAHFWRKFTAKPWDA